MRALWVLPLLVLVPFAGCLGGGPSFPLEARLFAFDPIERGDPTPVPMQSCSGLLDTLNERAERQALVALHQSVEGYGGGWGWRGGDMVAVADSAEQATSAPAAGGASARDAQVTGTNNQETGVDEADILKTDGEWTYVLRGATLFILHSDTVGNVSEHARIDLGDHWGGELLLEPRNPGDDRDDRLIVILHGGRVAEDRIAASTMIAPDGGYGMTRILLFDLTDRRLPFVMDEYWIEGDAVGARLVDGTAYIVVHAWEADLGLQTWAQPDETDLRRRGLTWDSYWQISDEARQNLLLAEAEKAAEANERILENATLRDHLPTILRPGPGGLRAELITADACQRVLATPTGTGRGMSTILAVDVGGPSLDSTTTQVMGGHPIVYGALDALVLAAPSQDLWWFWAQPELDEATDIHWFDLDGLDVTHRASGRVVGIVQDSFGLDVAGGTLRVATTTGQWGRWWLPEPSPMMNHLAVFEAQAGTLVQKGIVGGIAPGERIWSARFTDERAYIVTFEQIDPLWVIDLADPSSPRILGELEIPGVSTYIHPLSDDALLTIGYGPRPDGQGLDWGRIQVSLFDISDPTRPRRADVLDVSPGGAGWTWSSATQEHKAFTYWPALGKLAIPVSTQQEARVWTGGQWEWQYDQHIGLQLIDVDEAGLNLSRYGQVDQDHLLSVGMEYPHYGLDVERSYFLGFPQTGPVSVYSLSGLGLSAHDLGTLVPQGSVVFDVEQ